MTEKKGLHLDPAGYKPPDIEYLVKMPVPVKNKLIVIGWMGSKRCYLNVSVEEAKRRFIEAEGEPYLDNMTDEWFTKFDKISEFEFDDEFGAYDAWSL